MTDEDMRLFRETREEFLNVAAKLDAYNMRLDDVRGKLMRIEGLLEAERERISAFEPLLPAVFGAPGQTAGLLQRTSALELRAITWPQAAAIASFCGVLSSITATVTIFFTRGI